MTEEPDDPVAELSATLHVIARPQGWYHRVRFWAALAAAMSFHIGLVLAVGGRQRVSAHAYHIISTVGGPIVWGAGFMAPALVTALCVWRWHRGLRWALLAQSIPYVATSTAFAYSSIVYPDVILIASPMFAWVAILHAFLADYARKEF